MLKKSVIISSVVLMSMIPMFSLSQASYAADLTNGKETAIKVMEYNIHHAEGMDDILNLNRIGDVIKSSGADIIGLQEVDNHFSARSNFEDQAKWLANYLGMHYEFAANLDNNPLNVGEPRRQYGTVILSKYPILSSENHLLDNTQYPSEQRGLAKTVINVRGNHINFYNTHLDNKRAEQRDIQVNEILDIVHKSKGTSILVGDFNATPDSPEIIKMSAQYHDVFAELGMNDAYTSYYYSDKPNRRIDYIYTSDDVKIKTGKVIDTIAADHLPITAELVIKK
ncbi:endonuclease/exonuclease/phosphatase family protein [Paenibacillus qinlingensis]|uniref:Endonuclease/exonuclease/phosphatase family metal-dependent hydrolase n=1 Tax=Paenibacillus qinlingensis TaxID=1837343 RepID=A0ABU1NYV7_9BACL|nr:endonuclease/exonuclease/phosphatase family protein [Paenibacillus qinlingensis]MDR6552686.1 endonuclease/exonuclease/phosphatase family metal-dependent hydrolase [Paenibacillus qinlingensis]